MIVTIRGASGLGRPVGIPYKWLPIQSLCGFLEVVMNTDQVEGQWEQLKGKAKRIWGELTDDDILKAEGSADKLYGRIQERFGETKESIKQKLDRLRM